MITPIKKSPWVWFDVDDVLVNAAPLFQASMDAWTGLCIPWENWPHNQFTHFYGIADDDHARIAAMKQRWKDDQVLERAPLFPGVSAAMHRLVASGTRIGLITARAWHEDGEAITRGLVKRHALPVSTVISMDYHQTKADFLDRSEGPVVGFLDDTPRHVEACLAKGHPAHLLHQPWNATAQLPRVADLNAFVQTVRRNCAQLPRVRSAGAGRRR